jgi:hypothetical protein
MEEGRRKKEEGRRKKGKNILPFLITNSQLPIPNYQFPITNY